MSQVRKYSLGTEFAAVEYMTSLRSTRSYWAVKLLVIVFQFSAPAFAQHQLPTSESPIQVFHGENKPFTGAGLLPCPGCDKNTYSEDLRGSEIFNEKNKPNTLYTWTKIEWAKGRFNSLQAEKWEGLWRPLFLTRAPLSSYPYGDVSLRIKLKPDVKFKRERSHCEVSIEEAETTVYLFSGMMNEFLICSPKVIESMSIGMQEHYDEMIRDYLQHKLQPDSASYYMRIGNHEDNGFFNSLKMCPDSVCYREDKLILNLKTALQLIANDLSQIVFNPDAHERRSIQGHFKTASPMYFNEAESQ